MDQQKAAHAVSWPDRDSIPLTEMEYQILDRLRWGRMNKTDIAADLGYAPKTIKNYLSERIYFKLGVRSRLQAVMLLMTASVT